MSKSSKRNVNKKKKDYIIINLRVSSEMFNLASVVGRSVFNIKSISKLLLFSLSEIDNDILSYSSNKEIEYISRAVEGKTPFDKKYTLRVDCETYAKLLNLSSYIGCDIPCIVRKVISSVVLQNVCLPLPLYILGVEPNETGMVQMRFWCNKELLGAFSEIYKETTGEWNLTSALSDMMKPAVFKEYRLSKEITIGSSVQNIDMPNDYKYNFKVPLGRYDDYIHVCNVYGVSPYDGLRISIRNYIASHNVI